MHEITAGQIVAIDGKTLRRNDSDGCGDSSLGLSPIASDGRIYASNNGGTTFVVEAGCDFKLLARNQLGERITASPAVSGDELIYRTDSNAYYIGQPSGQ